MIFKFRNQYKRDIFEKLAYNFVSGKRIIDIGCGDGSDAEVFINKYKLRTYGIDIYENERILKIKGLKYKKASILKIPFKNEYFDYVFIHDVLHHIDEKKQDTNKHHKVLIEIKRVCKKQGTIIILEANRYNPLFFPHMVVLKKHNHFTQDYFIRLINRGFKNIRFKHFEAHYYPKFWLRAFKKYESIMENNPVFKPYLAYNVAIIRNDK